MIELGRVSLDIAWIGTIQFCAESMIKKKVIREIRTKVAEFVVEGKGCKCVEEEPWVTVAESSELVASTRKVEISEEAKISLIHLHQWKDR